MNVDVKDTHARCTWVMSPDGTWHSLCGMQDMINPPDVMELCPRCKTIVEHATWQELELDKIINAPAKTMIAETPDGRKREM